MGSAAVGVTVGSSGSSVAVDDDTGISVLVGVGGWGDGVSVKVDLAVRVGFAEQPETRITAANSRDVNFFILVLRENNSAVFTPCIIAQEAVKIMKILWISCARSR